MDAGTGSSSGPKPRGRRPSPDRRGGPAGTAQVARTQEDTAARYTRLVYSDITLGSEGDQENARVPAVRRWSGRPTWSAGPTQEWIICACWARRDFLRSASSRSPPSHPCGGWPPSLRRC